MYIHNIKDCPLEMRKYNKAIKKFLNKQGIQECYFDGFYYYYYETLNLKKTMEKIPFFVLLKSFLYDFSFDVFKRW